MFLCFIREAVAAEAPPKSWSSVGFLFFQCVSVTSVCSRPAVTPSRSTNSHDGGAWLRSQPTGDIAQVIFKYATPRCCEVLCMPCFGPNFEVCPDSLVCLRWLRRMLGTSRRTRLSGWPRLLGPRLMRPGWQRRRLLSARMHPAAKAAEVFIGAERCRSGSWPQACITVRCESQPSRDHSCSKE